MCFCHFVRWGCPIVWLDRSRRGFAEVVWSDLQLFLFSVYTFRNEGFRGFYKGLLPSLLRVTPATALTFVVYENVFHSLKSLSEARKHSTDGEDVKMPSPDASASSSITPKTTWYESFVLLIIKREVEYILLLFSLDDNSNEELSLLLCAN